jgi:hypothetical protein
VGAGAGGAGAGGAGAGTGKSNAKQVLCNTVVMASGLTKPNVPTGVVGIEHTIGYEDLPETGRSFEGQAVLVLGNGTTCSFSDNFRTRGCY